MRILCLGVNFRSAPLAIREKLAFTPASADRALRQLAQAWPRAEFFLLSTCNRTELYTARPLHAHPREEELLHWFGRFHELDPAEFAEAVYTHAEADAVGHLFSVAAGIDSLVPGEPQIVAQIKQAATTAAEVGPLASTLRNLIDEALRAAKDVRTRTGIAEGKSSVASVALDVLTQTFGDLADRCILSIGGGKISEILLGQARTLRPGAMIVANRSLDRAEELAGAVEAEPADLSDLPALLARADAVISSTASPEPIVTAAMLESCDPRPSLLLDLAVPRDIDPAVGDLPGVTLRNIDDLDAVVATSLAGRRDHLGPARTIINEHLARFMDNVNVQAVVPTLEALYARMEEIIDAELTEAANKFSTHDDSDEDMDILRRSLRRSMRRLCHPAAENLRRQAAAGHGERSAQILRKLLDLDE